MLKLKDTSTLSKREYIIDHILFGAFLGYDLVKLLLPSLVPITVFEQSLAKATFCMFITSFFGIVFTFSNNRTGSGVIFDILSGLGVYTCLILGKYVSGFLRFIFLAATIATLVGLIFITCRKIRNQSRRNLIIFGRLIKSTQLVRRNFCIACSIALFAIPITLHFADNKQLSDDYRALTETYQLEKENFSSDNIDVIEAWE